LLGIVGEALQHIQGLGGGADEVAMFFFHMGNSGSSHSIPLLHAGKIRSANKASKYICDANILP
jgi:hypothetical protein